MRSLLGIFAVLLLLAATPCWAPPIVIPAPDPGAYPPGTVFSVTIAPDGRLAWAPSQDPDRPAITNTRGERVPVVPYTPGEFPVPGAPDFAVARNGGHLTLAQLLFFEDASPAMRDQISSGRHRISRETDLHGYTALTVTFERNPDGSYTPRLVGWKSLQLNANTWREYGGEPPLLLKETFLRALRERVSGVGAEVVRCRLIMARFRPPRVMPQ